MSDRRELLREIKGIHKELRAMVDFLGIMCVVGSHLVPDTRRKQFDADIKNLDQAIDKKRGRPTK